jgi:putative acetyltransferase
MRPILPEVHLRRYRDEDAAATRTVFERAVRITASRHYTPEQVTAWAPVDRDPSAWTEWATARAAAHTVVAVDAGEVVGFSDLVHGDLLDMLYVDPRAGGRGIGPALIREIISVARAGHTGVIETYASLTARPVFERAGFVVIEECMPVVRGVAMTNLKMHLPL